MPRASLETLIHQIVVLIYLLALLVVIDLESLLVRFGPLARVEKFFISTLCARYGSKILQLILRGIFDIELCLRVVMI